MSTVIERLNELLIAAIKHFWAVRESQATKQRGHDDDEKDRGDRGAVTGGKHMDGFIRLVRAILIEGGLTTAHVFCKPREETDEGQPKRKKRRKKKNDVDRTDPESTQTVLPGWFRPGKDWDFVVMVGGCLVAVIEFKSHVGSFGNNFNNRTEEALGNATDILAAYREGAFKPSLRPWLGYLMLLEDAPKSTRPVRAAEPHFRVFDEFRQASYTERYNILLTKLVRERLYDSACFITSKRAEGLATGQHTEPNPELSFKNFVTALLAHAIAVAKTQPPAAESP